MQDIFQTGIQYYILTFEKSNSIKWPNQTIEPPHVKDLAMLL